jgi:hypothetical protein
MARTVRQGGQTILVLSDAEMTALAGAVSLYDCEPDNMEEKTPAEVSAFERVATAILPNRARS